MKNDSTSIDKRLLIAAVEASSEGVVISDARQPDAPLIYVNPAFTRITGYSHDEAVGRNCRFLQGTETGQEGLATLRQCLANGESCRVTLRNYRKDGTLFWNELHISPLREGDEVTFFVGIQTDVTERVLALERSRKLQKDLEAQNVKLEDLNKTKNEFLGMAAHDLRNPLTSIVLTTSILQESPLAQSAECRKRLTVVRESADFMLSLIEDLLDVSVIEAGHLELRLEKHSLVEVTVQTVGLHRHRAREKQMDLSFNIATDNPAMSMMDRKKIRQVVDNILSNALKYSPVGARITVTVGAEDTHIWVAVQDTGPGIPEEEVKRLFKPFGRIQTRTTGGERSTGLGLAISRRIAEAHGGRIEVETEIGKGSTFRLVLPVRH